jgi:glycosyltransferase involved in cell wall biosynthesis
MKALFVSNDPMMFIETSAVRARLRAYAALMDELHVLSVASAEASEEPVRDGALTLYPVRARGIFRLSALASKARALIRARGIDVVSAQDPFEHGLVALLATLGTEAKLHIQIHTDPFSRAFARESAKNRARLAVMPVVLFFSDGVRVVSERVKHALAAAWYGRCAPAASVIPVALPEDDPPPMPLPPNDFMFPLIAVSRLEPEKRVEDILAALSLVRRKYPGVGIFIAGEGRESAMLEGKAESLGLGNHAVFLGGRADARGLMQSAKAFVQASAYEGYGLTLLEAALARTPIVTTDVGIVGDVLVAGEDALIVPVGDVEALAASITRLIEKSDLGAALSASAYRKAAEHRSRYADQPAMVAGDLAATLRPPERVVPVI